MIAGPTASGKTAVAIALAKRLGTEIVSADSRQCYKGMAIGTAQPTPEELAQVRHYFVNEYPVTKALTAADYEELALGYIEDIFSRHDTAVVCGGTGLYIKALCEGLDPMPETDATIVQQTEEVFRQQGMAWLQHAVATEDPEYYAKGEIHNPARMLRALSFVRSTGKSIVHYRTNNVKQRPFEIVKVALDVPRAALYERINERVDKMIADGLEDEVRQLLSHKQLKNLQTVGYAELFDYIDGKCTWEEAVDKIKQHTRNYAKRQITWFKKDKGFVWIDPNANSLTDEILQLPVLP